MLGDQEAKFDEYFILYLKKACLNHQFFLCEKILLYQENVFQRE